MKAIVFKRSDGQYDWKLVAENGEQLCGSLQGYTERNDAHEGFYRVADAFQASEPIPVVDE